MTPFARWLEDLKLTGQVYTSDNDMREAPFDRGFSLSGVSSGSGIHYAMTNITTTTRELLLTPFEDLEQALTVHSVDVVIEANSGTPQENVFGTTAGSFLINGLQLALYRGSTRVQDYLIVPHASSAPGTTPYPKTNRQLADTSDEINAITSGVLTPALTLRMRVLFDGNHRGKLFLRPGDSLRLRVDSDTIASAIVVFAVGRGTRRLL